MPMAGLALTQHLACGHVQRREQRRGTVALVVVGDPFDVSQAQGQQRLTALQGLDLTLLIDAQDHRMVRRVEVQPHNVAHFIDEEGVGGQLEMLLEVRLEPESLPDAMDRVLGLATLFGHAAHGPVSLVLRRRLQGLVDDLGHLLVRDGPGCPRTPETVPGHAATACRQERRLERFLGLSHRLRARPALSRHLPESRLKLLLFGTHSNDCGDSTPPEASFFSTIAPLRPISATRRP